MLITSQKIVTDSLLIISAPTTIIVDRLCRYIPAILISCWRI